MKSTPLPRKAVILAAGLGTRMRPLTAHTTKALLPFAGRPIIDHTISNLLEWGVQDIMINLHHCPSSLVEYIRSQKHTNASISFSFEPQIRGTGGALQHAAWFIEKEPFWMVNSDVVMELNPDPLLDDFHRKKPIACLWMTAPSGPRTVEIKNGNITSFASSRAGTTGAYTFTGVHLLSPRIMKYIDDASFSSIIDAYRKAMKDGKKVRGIEVKGSYWADTGTPENLLRCHRELADRKTSGLKLHDVVSDHVRKSNLYLTERGATVKGMASVCADVSVSRSSVIENSILDKGSTIDSNSFVANCIVAAGVHVSGKVRRAVVPFHAALDRADLQALDAHAWSTRGVVAEALAPRGSDRVFYRLHGATQAAVLIKYDCQARPENSRFAANLHFLSTLGVPVPRLLLDLPVSRINIVEDLGNTSLQDVSTDTLPQEQHDLYERVLHFTSILHSKGAELASINNLKLEPPFNAKLYKWERELFAKHYLSGIRGLESQTCDTVLSELSAIPRMLKDKPVLIHRDLQSSNIMLKAGRPVFIDFQGMRLGSRYYDLASLLLDPYVCLSRDFRRSYIDRYATMTRLDPSEVETITHIAGIQRLAQALGAFGRLSRIDGMSHFARYIPAAERLMSECMAYTLKLPSLAGILAH